MTEEEFENLVSKGRKLVILDNLVLDVEKFMNCHPGGRWNIEHNIGKDIAKFFYGGYSIDGNRDQGVSPTAHAHSNFARMAVNQMVIARYCAFN
jgi:cytochrome b involved in lipid metabolism